jgi:tetratricopeptide (TPR) repeat protein
VAKKTILIEPKKTGPPWGYLIGLFLVAMVLIPYWQVLGFDFVNYDDNLYISDNARLKAGLTLDNVAWAFTTGDISNWHPLTWLSYLLDVQIFGEKNAPAIHMVNVLFHAVNSVLLFLLLRRMTRAPWPSALVAALFAVHPLHVESVAWIAERKDVLSTFFWLLTMMAYVGYAAAPGAIRYLLVVVPFALGLMAKPMLVTLPAVLLLMDYWPLRRLDGTGPLVGRPATRWHWLVIEKFPLFALAAISSVVTFLVQQSGHSIAALDALPAWLRAANAIVAYARYVVMMVWPVGLAVFYPHPGHDLPAWQVVVAGAALVAVSGVVIRWRRQFPYLVVGWLWYLGTLAPVIGLVQVGAQALADRYTYVPLIGLFLMAAWGIRDLAARWRVPKMALAVGAAVVLTALTAGAGLQVSFWRDSTTLFNHALRVTSFNYLAHKNLGVALANAHRYNEAIRQYEQAIKIKPDDPDLYYNFGNALGELGKTDEAIQRYSKALEVKPNHTETLYNLGNAYAKQGKFAEAVAQYAKLLDLKPDHLGGHINIGNALALVGRPEQAEVHYKEALRLEPGNQEALANLGNALGQQNKLDEAVEYYRKALQMNPNNLDTQCNLGHTLITQGKLTEAAAAFGEALRIDPGNVKARETIKALQAELDRRKQGAGTRP